MKHLPFTIYLILTITFSFLAYYIIEECYKKNENHSLHVDYKRVKYSKELNMGPFGSGMRLKQDENALSSLLLSKEICFLGFNQRPDANSKEIILMLRSNGECINSLLNKPIFLAEGKPPSSWSFNDIQSPFYILITEANESSIKIEAFLKRSSKHEEQKVEEFFISKERPKVDSFFNLLKHDLKWYGKDLFLQDHGGSNLALQINEEKITYSNSRTLHVKASSQYIWNNLFWEPLKESPNSKTHYLLTCEKVSSAELQLNLWSPFGVDKELITLYPSSKSEAPLDKIAEELLFLSIKNPSKISLKFNSNIVHISPGDWALIKSKNLEIISSKEDLQRYIEGDHPFPLLVFDQLKKKEGSYVLNAHLYNTTRTKKLNIELPLKKKSISNYAYDQTKQMKKEISHDDTFNL